AMTAAVTVTAMTMTAETATAMTMAAMTATAMTVTIGVARLTTAIKVGATTLSSLRHFSGNNSFIRFHCKTSLADICGILSLRLSSRQIGYAEAQDA
ncbi:MAG TPA: hypothetical protein PLM07_11715, partial [Candidatus Rifleibacterium sp.]|nr:hypothetical protein [Candidatus Rifleibacterium sp.]